VTERKHRHILETSHALFSPLSFHLTSGLRLSPRLFSY
jgi:hypothetical protein